MLVERLEVEPFGVVGAAPGVADRHHLEARLGHQPGRAPAHRAVALDGDSRRLLLDVEVLQRLQGEEGQAPAGRLVATFGAADVDRLAGDRGRHRVAGVHRERVHDPGHDLGGGPHVGGRDVLLGPDQERDLGGVAARQVLQLGWRQPPGIHVDAALGAAVGKPDHRALPGHQHRHRLDRVEGQAGLVADAALGGTAADVVLHPVAGEELDGVVLHVDREVHHQLPLHLAQLGPDGVVEVEHVGREVELVLRRGVGGLRSQLDGHAADTTARKCGSEAPSSPASAGTPWSPCWRSGSVSSSRPSSARS